MGLANSSPKNQLAQGTTSAMLSVVESFGPSLDSLVGFTGLKWVADAIRSGYNFFEALSLINVCLFLKFHNA